MRRLDLAKKLSKKTKMTFGQAEKLIGAFSEVATKALVQGQKIVYSNFGTFRIVNYPSKVITHPKLGKDKKIIMLPTNVVKWTPSNNIRELVAGKPIVSEAVEAAPKKSEIDESETQEIDIKIAPGIHIMPQNQTSEKEQKWSKDNHSPVRRIIDSLLRRAIRDRASDIHLEPINDGIVVRFRIDGYLSKKMVFPPELKSAAIKELKRLAGIAKESEGQPTECNFSVKIDDKKADFILSVLPVADGEKMLIKVLNSPNGVKKIDQLGMADLTLEMLKTALQEPSGLLILTGPKDSGSTTTLYAIAQELYYDGGNIMTLEDPIEQRVRGINQSQISQDHGYTFAIGLKSILRHDPDAIFVGKMADEETAALAFEAADNGHKIIAYVPAQSIESVLSKLVDWNIKVRDLSATSLIINQRLVRKVCDSCKASIVLTNDEIEKINKIILKMTEKERDKLKSIEMNFCRGAGCKQCNNTGYNGRIGLFETIARPKDLHQKTANDQSDYPSEISQALINDGIAKAAIGLTTIDEIFKIANC